jgi:hypothetical protein
MILYNASFLLTDFIRKQTEGIVLKRHLKKNSSAFLFSKFCVLYYS